MIVCHCFQTEIWLFAATRLCWNAYVGFSFLALSGQRWITDVLVGMKASRSELFGHSKVSELLREVWTVWMIDTKNYLHSIVHIQFKIAKWFHSSAQTPWMYLNYISNIMVCHSAQELSRAIRALQDARRECIACHAALAGDACTLVMKSLDGRVSDKQDPSECITFVSLFCYQK